eukprot:6093640-Amphidinium_carterae.2
MTQEPLSVQSARVRAGVRVRAQVWFKPLGCCNVNPVQASAYQRLMDKCGHAKHRNGVLVIARPPTA